MRFLTALSEKIEIGHLPESVPLAEAFSNRHDYGTLLDQKSAFVVLVCFEEADSYEDIKESADQIKAIYSSFQREANTICLVPFGHLSTAALADIDQIDTLLDKLYRTLSNMGLKVKRVPVAQGNVFFARFLFFDKLRSTKLRSSVGTVRKSLKSLIRVYGIKKIMVAISDVLIQTQTK